NVLEKELRPARAIEFRSVGRELTAAYAGEERAFFERTVDEHTDIVLATERQETLLGLAGRERIVELGEVELFRTQHALEVVVRSDRVVRNPDVAYRTLVFQTAQRAGMRTPVDQIVNLQQVDTRRPQKTHRLLDLRDPLVPTARPDLRGEERLIALTQLVNQVARRALRGAVHGRAVDDAGACLVEDFQHIEKR